MTAHSLATAVIDFDAAHTERVELYLESLGNPAYGDIGRRLDATGVIHFTTISVVGISEHRAAILIELSADGGEEAALDALVDALPTEMQQILRAAALELPLDWRGWLRAQQVRLGQGFFSTCGLAFDGSPAMSIARIRRENTLAEWIEDQPDLLRGRTRPAEKLLGLRSRLWSNGAFKWAFVPQPCPILSPAPPATLINQARIVLTLLFQILIWPWPILPVLSLAVALLPHTGGLFARLVWSFLESCAILVVAAVTLILTLRHLEKTEPAPDAVPDARLLEKVLSRENIVGQNILMTTSVMKPAGLRRLFLHIALLIIGRLLPLAFVPGQLGDISDIHFARWILLPKSGVLVFRSNYDGSWLTYLFDFVQRAPQGVTMIWSNTIGFPRSSWFYQDGAADGPRFLQWARTQTRPAPFWYTAYPTLSMARIRLNAGIARAIATGRLDPETAGWFRSLGAATAVQN